MKKTILALILSLTMIFGLCACSSGEGGAETTADAGNDTVGTTAPVSSGDETTKQEDLKNWGKQSECIIDNDGKTEYFYINFPIREGGMVAYDTVAEQGLDSTIVMAGGQNKRWAEVNSLSEVFPACAGSLELTFKNLYSQMIKNYKVEVTSDSAEVIGDYQMHRFVGNISYDEWGETETFPFVAYATTLKSSGSYVYWLVYDNSDDKSCGELMAEQAYKMAFTLKEEG